MTVANQESRSSALPAWFKPDEFGDQAFNAATYVADLQQYVRRRWQYLTTVDVTPSRHPDHAPRIPLHRQVPLEVLHQELQAHLAVLHGDLVEVINQDYDGFLHLTSRMTSIQGAVKRIEGPLAVVKVGGVSWAGHADAACSS